MLTREELTDLLGMALAAREAGDGNRVLVTIDPLLRGPKADSYRAVYLMAAVASSRWTLQPGETFHRVRVVNVNPDGTETPGTADDLPPAVRTFAQMCAAAANKDRAMCRDLFVGFCGERSSRAQQLLLAALAAVHDVGRRELWGES